jgi:hypothetical protein
MILLDTNVISEIFRPRPDRRVISWIDAQPSASLYLCTPVLAELRFGIERLPAGARKQRLRQVIDLVEVELYRDRVLVFDSSAAAAYGRIAASREKGGESIQQMDALIAAIASVHGAAIATRNTRDFGGVGVELINPFELSGRIR